jgi:hypothetical protein
MTTIAAGTGDGGFTWRRVAAAVAVAAVLVGLAALVAWRAGWFRRPEDPRLVELKKFQDELVAKYPPGSPPKNAIEAAERVAAMGQFMMKVQGLPQELRPRAIESGTKVLVDAFKAKMDDYFALPRERRQKFLDDEIAQQEMMRKAFTAGQSLMKLAGMARPGGQGGQAAGAAPGGPPGGPPIGPPGGPPGGGTIEDRNRWRKNMIDRTSPEDRARYTEYRRAMEERRESRGLPSGGPR